VSACRVPKFHGVNIALWIVCSDTTPPIASSAYASLNRLAGSCSHAHSPVLRRCSARQPSSARNGSAASSAALHRPKLLKYDILPPPKATGTRGRGRRATRAPRRADHDLQRRELGRVAHEVEAQQIHEPRRVREAGEVGELHAEHRRQPGDERQRRPEPAPPPQAQHGPRQRPATAIAPSTSWLRVRITSPSHTPSSRPRHARWRRKKRSARVRASSSRKYARPSVNGLEVCRNIGVVSASTAAAT
jgi:hypothetical protein